jgi:gluconokinase
MVRQILLMGVSGSGKSTIGKMLADRLGCEFVEGDDFHADKNITKMAKGQSLRDEDRLPWLHKLNKLLVEFSNKNEQVIMSCSALKKSCRTILKKDVRGFILIFLSGKYEIIQERIDNRKDHFMTSALLKSQFDSLEIPTTEETIVVSIDDPLEIIVINIMKDLGKII